MRLKFKTSKPINTVVAIFSVLLVLASCFFVIRSQTRPIKEPLRLRGAMIGTAVDEKDLRDLAGWGANHVRWQLNYGGFPAQNSPRLSDEKFYDEWLAKEMDRLERLLPVCERLGLWVVLDLHAPPGGKFREGENTLSIMQNDLWQNKFVEIWKKIAQRFKGRRIIWAYDLVNEPFEGNVPPGLLNWRDLAIKTTEEIRKIDPGKRIVFEPAIDVLSREKKLEPLPFDGVAYSVHFYAPTEFTHQGVAGRTLGIRYPSKIGGSYWDKAKLAEHMKPIADFQKANGYPEIYIGELSVIRWAPEGSGEQWLSDVFDLLEQNGWSGAYHAFREWDGWSVEHDSNYLNKNRVPTTERKKILLDWFKKNK